jgi:hypothetical protein
MNVKPIISALSLVAILATPAMAQKVHKRALTPTADVMNAAGYIVGTDPDPAIRSELLRDAATALGAN